MRVGCLHRPHHAHQGNREHAHRSDEDAPICRYPEHSAPLLMILTNYVQMILRLDGCPGVSDAQKTISDAKTIPARTHPGKRADAPRFCRAG